ncbi:MAG TPA: TRAP transporter large permease subunit, partial [Candidatus Sulfotelmatobacter sp.]|nr:TRAP transporter large permease subunit [Candidatus Sulfotelmatobacter sp.]
RRRGSWSIVAAAVDRTLEVVLASALLAELLIVFVNTLNRALFGSSIVWTLEAAELALSTIAFLGGAIAYRRGGHACIQLVVAALPLPGQRACQALVELLVLVVAVTMTATSLPLFVSQWSEFTPILRIRTSWFVLPLVISMVVLAVTAIERLLRQHRGTMIAVGGCVAACVLVVATTREAWQPVVAGQPALMVALGVFFGTVLIGLPVGFALLLGALIQLYGAGAMPLIALAHTTVTGVGSFVLLALPFFILAAIIMNQGGLSARLVRLAEACVGHFRGGLLQVMVVSMYIVSGLSGSKSADMAAVGSVMQDMLRREGYSLEQSAAVLNSSAVMGETVPPSLAMLVLASVTTLSVGALFVGGLIPAAVVGACLMVLIYLQSRRARMARLPRATLRQLAQASAEGGLPLLMPVILIGGILLGVGTPTEVSSFAVVYGLVLSGLVYRQLSLRAFLRSLVDCAAVAGMILFILSAASSFAWMLTTAQLPQRLVRALGGVQQSQWLFMLASIVLLVVAGSVLEGLPALLILAPILMPIASQIGVSDLQYGIVLVLAMGLGSHLPPFGVGFYIACAICGTTIENSARAMLPYAIVLCLGLALVALVPVFTLLLPLRLHLVQ